MPLQLDTITGVDEDLPVTRRGEYVLYSIPFSSPVPAYPLSRSHSRTPPPRHRSHNNTNSIYPAIDPEPHYAAQTYRGKVVLVTGASRGVGRATALGYARAGASVAIVARTTDALAETRDAIAAVDPRAGAEVLVLAADVRDVEGARDAVRGVLRRFGKLDILVANAGAITAFTSSEAPPPASCFIFCLGRSDTRSILFIYFSCQSAE
jgi:NADPH:quinone reductase-like Zn-dependent oxidoreductase